MTTLHLFLVPGQHLLLSPVLTLRSKFEILQSFPSIEKAKLFLDKASRQYKLPVVIDYVEPEVVVEEVKVEPPASPIKKKSTRSKVPAHLQKKGSRPKKSAYQKEHGIIPPQIWKGVPKPRMTKIKDSIACKIRLHQCHRLWFTNGEKETRVLFMKTEYPTPESCPVPEGWWRGRSHSFKRAMQKHSADIVLSMLHGSEEKRRRYLTGPDC